MKKSNDNQVSSERRYQMHIQAFDMLEAGEEAQATEIIGQLLRLDPKEPLVDHIKGFILSEGGCQDLALPLLRRAARLLPDKSVPRVTLGIALMRAGELNEAQAILEQALVINPNCFDSLTNVAACLVTREKSPERAERLLRQADALRPDDQSVWANLGRALALQGKQAEADKALRHAIEIDPQAEVVQLIKAFCPHLSNTGINS